MVRKRKLDERDPGRGSELIEIKSRF